MMYKTSIFLILILTTKLNVYCQDFAPAYAFQRTFKITLEKKTFTSFLIDYKGENYFVTAKHSFSPNEKQVSFSISNDNKDIKVDGEIFFHDNPLVYIAVVKPSNMIKTDAILLDTTVRIKLGDLGFFFGYPLGLRMNFDSRFNHGYPFPLVKRANLSGLDLGNDVTILLLDGSNNPGFSGGPVFFKNRDNPSDNNWYLAGVISSYYNQWNKLETQQGIVEYKENSGIILAIGSSHIKDIIENIK